MDRSGSKPHEDHLLRLSIDKAPTELAWRPRWSVPKLCSGLPIGTSVVNGDPASAFAACIDDINAFTNVA